VLNPNVLSFESIGLTSYADNVTVFSNSQIVKETNGVQISCTLVGS